MAKRRGLAPDRPQIVTVEKRRADRTAAIPFSENLESNTGV
jgi:hypothetical protein